MKPVLVSEVSHFFNAKFIGNDFLIEGFSTLLKAKEKEISFFLNASFLEYKNSRASVLFVPKNFSFEPFGKTLIYVDNPYDAMVLFLKHFHLPFVRFDAPFISKNAKVHKTAIVEGYVDDEAEIGPYVYIGQGSHIGKQTRIDAHATIYPNVFIGNFCEVQAGAVIGSRGFGFYECNGVRHKVPHVSGVHISDNSSVGANSVIASGFLFPTTIGEHSHLDSFVQIGHNCIVGNHVYMASESALAGSTVVGDYVEFAGSAKASGHLTIGNHVKIAAKAGVTKNIPDNRVVAGFPAEEISLWRKSVIALKKIAKNL